MTGTEPHFISLGMSNFDRSIDPGLAKALKADHLARAQYSGWNFCAYVWVEPDDDQFTCEVWQYHEHKRRIRCATLEEIMEKVSEEFGWE